MLNFKKQIRSMAALGSLLWSGTVAAQVGSGVRLEVRTNDNVGYSFDGTCWSPPALAGSPDRTTGEIPLPAVVAQGIAVLQDYATLGKLRRGVALTEREVVFLRDEQDLRD